MKQDLQVSTVEYRSQASGDRDGFTISYPSEWYIDASDDGTEILLSAEKDFIMDMAPGNEHNTVMLIGSQPKSDTPLSLAEKIKTVTLRGTPDAQISVSEFVLNGNPAARSDASNVNVAQGVIVPAIIASDQYMGYPGNYT